MIDIDKIGQRIKEQRKYMMKVSQEKMAEDLNMYQADISNMEKAKSGSGINDLMKLDMLADYFHIPLETLLFGREDQNMLHYHGSRMALKPSRKKMPKSHRETLRVLTGQTENLPEPAAVYECGPYMIYTLIEYQYTLDDDYWNGTGPFKPKSVLPKYHTYVFLETELVAAMTADSTDVMSHVYAPALEELQSMIPFDILDVTDVWRTLNPYWALYQFSEDGPEKDAYMEKMYQRMDALRRSDEQRPVIYIESVYVREDCRQHGIFRMYIDLLKILFDEGILWLNMEPTSGAELGQEYGCIPAYSVSDLGQLNINAAIAEKVGFTVDPDTWHRSAETVDADGNVTVETILVRKCAYYLPKEIRRLLADDGDLVARGRALQKLVRSEQDPSGDVIDINHGYAGGDFITELRFSDPVQGAHYANVIRTADGGLWYTVTRTSMLRESREVLLEEYDSLAAAEASEYFEDLLMADTFARIAGSNQLL